MQNTNTKSFGFSNNIKLNFEGGQLSSDSGMLLIHEFCDRLGAERLLEKYLPASKHEGVVHPKSSVVYQKLMRIIAGYNSNNHAIFLKNDPIFKQMHSGKMASPSTSCRREQEFTFEDVKALQKIQKILQRQAYEIAGEPSEVWLDFDTTYDPASGKLHGSAYNHHYGETGFSPLVCFEGLTGDMIKGNLRPGNTYCSTKITSFAEPILKQYRKKGIKVKTRGDSGFACPEYYEMCERQGALYYIKLKSNARLKKQIQEEVLTEEIMKNRKDTYGEISYAAESWDRERRILVQVKWMKDQLFPVCSAIVTNDEECAPEEGFEFYNGRATIENRIEEGKNGFGWDHLSSKSFEANSANFQIYLLAVQIVQLFRRICLPVVKEKSTIDTIRLMLIKVAARVVKNSRTFLVKCASCFPFQKLFLRVLENLQQIPQYAHFP